MRLTRPAIFALVLLCGGCTSFEFDILQPPTPQRHIGTDQDTNLSIDPLQYRFRAAEGRLVMIIFNPTADPIELLGARSTLVDPDSQSHPLRDRTIAPGTFIKEILPPFRPQSDQPAPNFGFGLGATYGSADTPGYVRPTGYGGSSASMDVYEDAGAYYWNWDGESDVRLTLVYSRGAGTFEHTLSFHRAKK